ncbi:membrane-associated protein [Pilibacter termitis]|uniref:Membrane-associated protein n=1 Tax=Pilibacter termitis TaxID=263852 RepID=A0A1T4KV09_9ENTE|nr:VTT domain-containing protein [Pilibacter termitis]SJZ46236.1 membrane-associated protein [Pilibacter termitis]
MFNFTELLTQLLHNREIYFYLVLGLIIFVETGIVIFPFLPGDSILFFAGSVAALGSNSISVTVLVVSLTILAFFANLLNYEIGRHFGESLHKHPKLTRFLKPHYIEEAEQFFEKYGSFAIFLGRFMPIIRTIVPFTAGTSKMPHKKFVLYNALGGFTWIFLCVIAGFFFGNIPFVQKHFELIMIAIIFVSLIPAFLMAAKRMIVKKHTILEEKKK